MDLPSFVSPLVALWLLALAWILNNPEAHRPRPRPRRAGFVPERCPLCGAAYDYAGPTCWCSELDAWH
jgi:hypothetical protein